jgi:hypothetical protein
MTSTNIAQFNTKPAQHKDKYHGYELVVTFDTENGNWSWQATKPVTTSIKYEGHARSSGAAFAAAKRRIDNG